jgi:hypothetical protein
MTRRPGRRPSAQVEADQRLGPDPVRGLVAEDPVGAGRDLPQRDLLGRHVPPAGHVILDEAGGDDGQHILELLDARGLGLGRLGRFKHQPDAVDAQDARDIGAEHVEERR